MTPRPTNSPPDRRQEILEVALELFAKHGYSSTTNAHIARAAGITPAALYYYFPSKEALFLAAIQERKHHVMPVIDQLLANVASADPRQVLKEIVQCQLQMITQPRTQALIRIVLAEGPKDAEVKRIWNEQITKIYSPFFTYLEQQMAAGRIRRMEPRLVILSLHGPLLMAVLLRDLLQVPMMQGLSNQMLIDQVIGCTLQTLMPTS